MPTKFCGKCRENKDTKEFAARASKGDKLQCVCKECLAVASKACRNERRVAGKSSYSANCRRRLRLTVLRHYGGENPACVCCGESTYEFLAIDHVDGGGAKHRKTLGGTSIYCWLKRNKFPPGFRVLCHNCNLAIGAYGYCPHTQPGFDPTTLTPASTRTKEAIHVAAVTLAASGVYPGSRRLARTCSVGISTVHRYRVELIAEGRWPSAEETARIAAKFSRKCKT